MTGRSRAVVVAMMLWWAFFGGVSVSWALGSPWLVDTVLQGEGLRLAQERPTWFVVVVLVSGLVKLGFVVFGFALLRPDVVRVPRWMRLAFGWVSGALLIAYGIVGSPAHRLRDCRLGAGDPEAAGRGAALPLWLVAPGSVDASFLGGRDPGAGRDGRLPALEPASGGRSHRARGPNWALTLAAAARPGRVGRRRRDRGEGRVCAPDCAPRPSTECHSAGVPGSTGSITQPAITYGVDGVSS